MPYVAQEHRRLIERRDVNCDLLERAFWEPQSHALFDICVLDVDSISIADQSLESIFQTRRNMNIDTYSKAAEARCAPFIPKIAPCDAILYREAEVYLKQLAVYMSNKKLHFRTQLAGLELNFKLAF